MTGSCPTPEKTAYGTRGAANHIAMGHNQRVYRCSCGRFHLASDYAAPESKRRRRMRRV